MSICPDSDVDNRAKTKVFLSLNKGLFLRGQGSNSLLDCALIYACTHVRMKELENLWWQNGQVYGIVCTLVT